MTIDEHIAHVRHLQESGLATEREILLAKEVLNLRLELGTKCAELEALRLSSQAEALRLRKQLGADG